MILFAKHVPLLKAVLKTPNLKTFYNKIKTHHHHTLVKPVHKVSVSVRMTLDKYPEYPKPKYTFYVISTVHALFNANICHPLSWIEIKLFM